MNRRLYACMVLLAIIICSSSSINNDRADKSPSIRYTRYLKNNHRDIFKLIKNSIVGGNSTYRLGIYDHLSDTKNHLLYFTERDTCIHVGAFTKAVYDTTNKFLYDTIVLNSEFLRRGCREYIVQLIVHESIHAFINWCRHSFKQKLNNVDSAFLRKYFKKNWQWIIEKPYTLNPIEEHSLMYQNYLDTMENCIRTYTKRRERETLQNIIARSMALGGLEDTPEWKKRSDTCVFRCTDNLAKNLNAENASGKIFDTIPCQRDGRLNTILKQIKDVLQMTNSAARPKPPTHYY
jgi:hypothetical protein